LEVATPDIIAQFDFYIIRILDTRQKLSDSDITQYKLSSVKENEPNNWKHVMCFLNPCPTGNVANTIREQSKFRLANLKANTQNRMSVQLSVLLSQTFNIKNLHLPKFLQDWPRNTILV
jgi:hypothetical protein